MATQVDEDSEVFQDFNSDTSDFDDDVDWNFTDGESASILQLMGGPDSIKKTQLDGTLDVPLSTPVEHASTASNVAKGSENITINAARVATGGCSDDELLDELFPKTKQELPTKVEKQLELQGEEGYDRSKECEVEWALMALEEHEQLGRQSRSTSPARGDTGFVSLFEEMYGGDTAIALSTPSPPAKLNQGRQESFGSKHPDEKEAMEDEEVCSPPITDEKLPVEILDMLRLIYKKAIEVSVHWCL